MTDKRLPKHQPLIFEPSMREKFLRLFEIGAIEDKEKQKSAIENLLSEATRSSGTTGQSSPPEVVIENVTHHYTGGGFVLSGKGQPDSVEQTAKHELETVLEDQMRSMGEVLGEQKLRQVFAGAKQAIREGRMIEQDKAMLLAIYDRLERKLTSNN